LNNQNRNNNRRRGRGNRNQGGGGHQQNRIDSRARGNAPQLLDKYKKLAQDAAHNGDRVQAEYFLQFADHYFRVIADNRSRQDDNRPRRDERDQDDDMGYDDVSDDRRPAPRSQRVRRDESDQAEQGIEGDMASADDNPFVREERPERVRRAERPERDERTERRPRRRASAPPAEAAANEGDFDATVLPPSLTDSLASDDKPRLRTRRRRVNNDEDTAEAVNS